MQARDNKINISNLNKAEVLVALYNHAKVQGMGFLSQASEPMTVAKAEEILKKTKSFDYLYGRVMKINLSGDELDTRLYNRDNGANAAENVLQGLVPSNQEASKNTL